MIEIINGITIGEDELVFRASRSRGPGGQNVNKVNTRVTLLFDVAKCGAFSELQKRRIFERLAKRVDKNGVLRVVSQRFRTQKANRNLAVERFCRLLKEALQTRAVRKETKIPYWAKQRRWEEKRRRSRLKKQRAERGWLEDLAD